MKTFKQFLEEYDWTNVKNPSTGKYQPRLDIKNSYMTGITQPSGSIAFTPTECEETKTTKRKINRKKNKKHKKGIK